MAVFDTHKAFETLTSGGFSEAQARALLSAMGESRESLATKADLRELELRVRLHLGAYVFAAAGLVIAVLIAYMELRG